MTGDEVATVGVVVVNYFGGDRTLHCLASLERLTWPADHLRVALVDNGSEAGFLDEVRRNHPSILVVEAPSNVGLGGGCNLGIAALADCAYVALLNNDATPDPGWLEPLVAVLESDPAVGAATPKVLLDGRFVPLEIRSTAVRPGRGDPRDLGVQLCGARVDGRDITDGIQLVSGFWGWERDEVTVGGAFAWTNGDGHARLPVPATCTGAGVDVDVRLACGLGDTEATVAARGASTTTAVTIHPSWTAVGVGVPPVDLVNNTGTILLADGSTADRGYLEADLGSFDDAVEVFGWSAAAVLLSRRFLADVGGFDEAFFLYYEDADLSWRGRLRGWSYRYEPRSVVRHEHSATVGDRSALAHHLVGRNRLVMLVKNAPTPLAGRAVVQVVQDLVAAVIRDLLLRALRFRRPVVRHVVAQARALGGFVRMLPAALRARRRQHVVGDRAAVVETWAAAPAHGHLRAGARP